MAEILLAPPDGVDLTQDVDALHDYLEPLAAALSNKRPIAIDVGGTARFRDAVTMDSTLSVTGAIVGSDDLNITGNFEAGGSVQADTGLTVMLGGANITGNEVLTGNLTVQNSVPTVALSVTVTAGSQLVRIGTSGSPLVRADIQNAKVIVGSGTDPSVSGEKLVVLAGPTVIGYDNDQALYFQRPSSSPMTLGTNVSGNPSLIVKDATGAQVAAFLSVGAGNGLIVGTATAFAGGENLRVGGGALIEGDLIHTGAKAGFYAQTPVTRQSIGGAATDPATNQTLTNNIRSALNNLGLTQT